MKRFVLLAGVVFVLSMASLSVAAEKVEQDPRFFLHERYIVDGKDYSKDQIIRDFLKIAFSTHMWFEDKPIDFDSGWTVNGVIPIDYIVPAWNKKESGYDSWVLNLLLTDHPKFDSINRWSGDLTVGFGWPPFDSSRNMDAINPPRFTEIDESLSAKVTSFLPKLTVLTGHRARLIHPKDETLENYAKIRIIVTDSFFMTSKDFRSDRIMEGYHLFPSGSGVRLNERDSFSKAVRFSPFLPYQVEGYVFPDGQNNIQFAVCQLNPKLGEKVMLTLLTECLARVLGLPEGGILHKSSIFYPRATAEEATIDRPTFSPYDEAIISLLYCDKLKAGMGRSDVLRTLYFEPSCFKKFKLRER